MAPAPPPSVTNGTQLPGAFLFVTYTPLAKVNKGKKWSGIAYDPYAQNDDTVEVMTKRYLTNGLPYYELFTSPDQTKDNVADWNVSGKTYMGIFGRNAGPFTAGNVWPYANADATCPIKTGICISFWNKDKNHRGLETNGASSPFDCDAATTYMGLLPGKSTDLLKPSGVTSTTFSLITLDWYAMQKGSKLNLS